MPRRKLPYQEGDWFAVPLRTGGYALGLIARVDGKGGVLGYFFGPRYHQLPSKDQASKLAPADAILIRRFGDLGLLQGEWPIIYRPEQWDRRDWPVPPFSRIAMDKSWAIKVVYSDDLSLLSEAPITVEEAQELPEDGLSGYGALEIRLTKLLNDRSENSETGGNHGNLGGRNI
ncbi:immunity 26/phosphotriesterase HocA family protein [Kallotenue papyrolyticum]|uniref:immunity 26/phosphotriesterase HocA family protein n=1 Tax=Kallotenue papyrolyticum TaxID=1325125 RepID=UPI0009E06B82